MHCFADQKVRFKIQVACILLSTYPSDVIRSVSCSVCFSVSQELLSVINFICMLQTCYQTAVEHNFRIPIGDL